MFTLYRITSEGRVKLIKSIEKDGEKRKIELRQIRQNARKELTKDFKKTLSSDELKKCEKDLDSITDRYVKQVDNICNLKEKEISNF